MSAGDAVTRRVVTFGRILREAGLEVGPGRLQDCAARARPVDLTRRDEVYHALRCTLVSRHDEIEAFDAAFAAFWERAAPQGGSRPPDLGIEAPDHPPPRRRPRATRTLAERGRAGRGAALGLARRDAARARLRRDDGAGAGAAAAADGRAGRPAADAPLAPAAPGE